MYNVPLDLTWKNESIFTDRFSPNVNNYIIYRAVGTGGCRGAIDPPPFLTKNTFTFKKALNYWPKEPDQPDPKLTRILDPGGAPTQLDPILDPEGPTRPVQVGFNSGLLSTCLD